MPSSPATHRYPLDSVKVDSSRGITIKRGESKVKLFVIRRGQQIYCYHNICPHMGVNLDWVENQFLDTSAQFIQCATHGALFQIEDGLCVAGPCQGQKLSPVKVNTAENYFEILL